MLDEIDAVLDAIYSTDALNESRELAIQEAQMAEGALSDLPDSQYRDAMVAIARYVTNRTS